MSIWSTPRPHECQQAERATTAASLIADNIPTSPLARGRGTAPTSAGCTEGEHGQGDSNTTFVTLVVLFFSFLL